MGARGRESLAGRAVLVAAGVDVDTRWSGSKADSDAEGVGWLVGS